MTRRLDIRPGEGIGPIRRGMKPAEVLAAFTEPRVYEDWMGGNLNGFLLFHGLCLNFTEYNGWNGWDPSPQSTLIEIWIHGREDAYLFDRSASDWTKPDVGEELRLRGYHPKFESNGDITVKTSAKLSYDDLELSFDELGRLDWIGLSF